MDQFPSAILLAQLKDVVMNNNVLHRLVRPTEQGTQVVSVDRLVNVVPHRRIYRFDRKDELNEFCNELLRRPLVLQPVVHFGRGLGRGSLACGMCYKDDKWVMMVNQTHPKILSRLQIGLDAARKAMANGQSFEVTFAFTKLVEKLYRKTLTKSEQEAAANHLDLVKTYFRYAEWEYGDLILRYHGYGALLGRGGGLLDKNLPTLNLTFEFEDLWTQEISWRTLGAEYFPHPHLSPVTEDEIRERLPAWTVNGVSPLENIGDHVPAENYSYAQAGRLYESFRKKKRKPRTDVGDMSAGGAPEPRPTASDGIELKVMGGEGENRRWRRYNEYENDVEDDHGFRPQGSSGVGPGHVSPSAPPLYGAGASFYDGGVPTGAHAGHVQSAYPEDDGFYEEKGAKPKAYRPQGQFDSHGHLYPKIRVNAEQGPDRKPSQGRGSSPSYQSPKQDQYPDAAGVQAQFTRLRMQGSDRSSHSEAGSGITDSGIDSDGHAREGSFDRPPYTHPHPHSGSPPHPYAMDNHAFHHEEDSEVNEAMRKHKELIAKMMAGSGSQAPVLDYGSGQSGYHDNRQQRHTSQSSDRDRQYANGKAGHPLPSPRSGLPSPNDLSGKQHNYSSSSSYGPSGSERSPSWQNPQSSRQLVEESFI
ncbi:hypothetical protein BaRGS_00009308 [Batillaria attramentaria]|uniref:Uncharacterized protein n=1 Tax=Batillaria attramentaria TaxID=370345 RepID=A0ABD0LJJ1_9CAEN